MDELDTIVKILKEKNTFQYPLISTKDGYLKTLSSRLDEYVKRIKLIEEKYFKHSIVQLSESIEKTGQDIIEVIKLYLSGKGESAYKDFSKILNDNRTNIENLTLHFEEDQELFYRVRYSEKEITAKSDIFHIPFSLRHLVGTMRYSIAGVPCLYFGNTIYDCWLEMDKPDLNKLYISKFKNTREINILDFAITFHTLNKMPTMEDQRSEHYSKEKIESFLALYPLILACSFKKQYENAKFDIEYIIPNMLLQWISNQKEHIDGIRYFSTKMKHDRYNSIGINTVFPPKDNKDSMDGFCPVLKHTFKFTAPISWSMINTLPLKDTNDSYRMTIVDSEKILQSVDEVIDSHYKITKFYQVEKNIDNYFEFLELENKQRPKKASLSDDWS
jgi:hypothetical protein